LHSASQCSRDEGTVPLCAKQREKEDSPRYGAQPGREGSRGSLQRLMKYCPQVSVQVILLKLVLLMERNTVLPSLQG